MIMRNCAALNLHLITVNLHLHVSPLQAIMNLTLRGLFTIKHNTVEDSPQIGTIPTSKTIGKFNSGPFLASVNVLI